MWVVPVVPWVEVLRWLGGGLEVLGGWVEKVLVVGLWMYWVVGTHYLGWKGARTIYAD